MGEDGGAQEEGEGGGLGGECCEAHVSLWSCQTWYCPLENCPYNPDSPAPCFTPGNLHIFSTRVSLEVDYPWREVRYLEPVTPQSWLLNLDGREVARLQEGEHRRLPTQPRVTDTVVVWSGNGMVGRRDGAVHHWALNNMSTVAPSAVDLCSTS